MRYFIETLGCPKNHVDSEKLAGLLITQGYEPTERIDEADLVVANTCAFIEAAREESVDTVLELAERKRDSARLVVTGCMAERYGDELAAALPEVDLVAGFGQSLIPGPTPTPVTLAKRPTSDFDLLNLPRPRTTSPWAYVKIAEGCDRRCGFCAIPSFRGDQRSRAADAVLEEARGLAASGVRELVLVAQDLASWGLDRRRRRDGLDVVEPLEDGTAQPLVRLVEQLAREVDRVRLLYLYPSSLTPQLIDAIVATGVTYFDLSLQHVTRAHLRRMSRWGDADRFLERIARIRALAPDATFRSSFILGYPGETEDDHRQLLAFLEEAQLDWAGFFPFSPEEGTPAAAARDTVDPELALDRLREVSELQDAITARRRDALVGTIQRVLVDRPGVARSVRECPEIDGIVEVSRQWEVGSMVDVRIVASHGVDVVAR